MPKEDSQNLKVRILDSAERLFAEHGYDGTSIRDIASGAQVQLSLVSYHFGSKEDLLDSVLGRRAEILGAQRMAALAAARERYAGGRIPPDALVRHYIECFLARAATADGGWRSYVKLVADLTNSALWGNLISKHFDAVAREYVAELQKTYGGCDPEKVMQGFFYTIAVMVAACSRAGRIERLSDGLYESVDVTAMLPNIIAFAIGGIDRLARG
jgi:AcrR family transcriptional regulator